MYMDSIEWRGSADLEPARSRQDASPISPIFCSTSPTLGVMSLVGTSCSRDSFVISSIRKSVSLSENNVPGRLTSECSRNISSAAGGGICPSQRHSPSLQRPLVSRFQTSPSVMRDSGCMTSISRSTSKRYSLARSSSLSRKDHRRYPIHTNVESRST